MSWTNSDPMATAFGTAAAFMKGQQDAKDRKTKDAHDDEQDRQAAIAAQAQVGYKNAEIGIQQQNADTNTARETDTKTARDAATAEKVKNDLMVDATKRFAIQQTAIYHSQMSDDMKWRTLAQIQARNQEIQAQIAAGALKTDKEVAAKYAAIDASIQNNIRTTTTSKQNNERTTTTSADNNLRTTTTAAADNANTVAGANQRGADSNGTRLFGIEQAANNAAGTAGTDAPYPGLRPPTLQQPTSQQQPPTQQPPGTQWHGGGRGSAQAEVAQVVTILQGQPKAQRVPTLMSSNKYKHADPATQKAMLAAVQAMP